MITITMMIRNFLFYLGVIPATIIFTLLTTLIFFTPFKVRYFMATRWSHFLIFWAKVTCGLSYRVEGVENLPKHGGAIIVANHQSTWETIFMQVLLPYQSWVLKRELLFIPFFGWGLYLIEPIAIRRKQFNSLPELIEQGSKRLKQGRFVVIFPEGTRVAANTLGKFSRSAAALAEATGALVVPVAHNAGQFWPRGIFIQQPGTVEVRIGPVIDPKGKSTTEVTQLARKWVDEHLPRE